MAVAVGNDRQFTALTTAIGAPALGDDPRFQTNTDRVAHRAELVTALTAVLTTRPADEWMAILAAAGVPAGPVNDIAQAFALASELGLDPIVDIASGNHDATGQNATMRQVADPIGLSATPAQYYSTPPRLGEHNADVLG